MASVFLDDFKRYLEFDVTDETQDNLINDVLLGTQAYIGKTYGTVIGQLTRSVKLNGDGLSYLYLNESPLVSISALTISGTFQDTSNYYFKDNEIRLIAGNFSVGKQNIEIDYVVGYDDTDIPDDLKLALFKLSEKLYYDATQNRDGITTVSNDIKQRASFYDKIPYVAQSILYAYRIIRF